MAVCVLIVNGVGTVACSARAGDVVPPPEVPTERVDEDADDEDARNAVFVRARAVPTGPRVGDTVRVEAAAVTASDSIVAVDGFGIEVIGGELVRLADETRLLAVRPGRADVRVRFPYERAGPSRPNSTAETAIAVRVAPAPTVRLELDAPDRLPIGARVTVRARAVSAFGPGHPVTGATWRSSAPAIVAAGPGGALHALAQGKARVEVVAEGVSAAIDVRVVPNRVRRVDVFPPVSDVAVGETVHLTAVARDGNGQRVEAVATSWMLGAPSDALTAAGVIDRRGTFVANEPGTYRVAAIVGGRAGDAEVRAAARAPGGPLDVVGRAHAPMRAGTRSVAVFEGIDGRDYAYLGAADAPIVYAWDVTESDAPRFLDSLRLNGNRVTGVAVDAGATLGVVATGGTRSEPGELSVLDLLDPSRPRVVAVYRPDAPGVGALAVDGDLVYAANAHSGDLVIVDLATPAAPRLVSRWSLGSEVGRLHGISVRNGLAYVAGGVEGMIVLDVGAGIEGGTVDRPREVSRHVGSLRGPASRPVDAAGATRFRDLVFVAHRGDPDCAGCGDDARGYVEVVDVTDVRQPRGVAFYAVPGGAATDLHVQDELLYVAANRGGVRVVDVSGELRDDLWRQGRDVGWRATGAPDGRVPNLSAAVGVQAYKGRVYASDEGSGLWILERETTER